MASFSYKKLFKLLIDRNMKKKDLCDIANVSTSCVTKLANNQHVNTEILERICGALNCDIGDILEVVHTKNGGEENE